MSNKSTTQWLYKIGDKVTITHTSCFVYNNEREKVIQSKQLDQPIQATICGAIHKRMGKINQGYSDGLEYYPPSLTISHTVPVYKVKKTIISKEDYVLPEHIVSDAHKKSTEIPL